DVFNDHMQYKQQQKYTSEPCGEFVEPLGTVNLAIRAAKPAFIFCFWPGRGLAKVGFRNVFGGRRCGGVYRRRRLVCHGKSWVLLLIRVVTIVIPVGLFSCRLFFASFFAQALVLFGLPLLLPPFVQFGFASVLAIVVADKSPP